MITKQFFLKTTALFLMLTLVLNVLAPGISYALTSGPTTPEATSFQPVDTTDMIDLLTGDLGYSAPLIDVPGPEGGYAMALSYHDGILPDEDASWVGLGWSLNPGVVNRTINGFADDHSSSKIKYTIHEDVGGGQAITTELIGAPGSYMGLIYEQNQYPYKGTVVYNKAKYAFIKSGQTGTFNASSMQKHDQEQYAAFYRAALGWWPTGLGRPPELELYMSRVSPEKFMADVVPVPEDPDLNIHIKDHYFRYFYIKKDSVYATGTLKASSVPDPEKNIAFDCYALADPEILQSDPTYNVNTQLGGSFPSYDNYHVSAQGINGNMQPYLFENGSLYRQNVGDNTSPHTNDIKFKKVKAFSKPVAFRFAGDFSNKLSITPEQVSFTSDINSPGSVSSHAISSPSEGFNSTTQRLAGSKHIEWFTNEEVSNGTAKSKGLIGYVNEDNQNNVSTVMGKKDFSTITGHIAAFMITNSNGMTYHYALPVYAYDEFSVYGTSALISTNRIEQTNKDPYAYQWMLTAVTGPDYVDVNNDGLVNDTDWGYWVSLGYGKWTDKFIWRTPDIGYAPDIDGVSQAYSSGKKELYYLDFVKTRTHTALFMKDMRHDGKGVGGYLGDYTSSVETGSEYTSGSLTCTENKLFVPVSTLKLDKILLLKNDDLNSYLQAGSWNTLTNLKKNGTALNEESKYVNVCSGGATQDNTMNLHFGKNVLDIHDITTAQSLDLTKRAIKTIILNTDYSLCANTPNSIVTQSTPYAYSYQNSFSTIVNSGKLTLKSIKVLGNGGADILPATNFTYDVPDPKTQDIKITSIPGELTNVKMGTIQFGTTGSTNFVTGDIIRFTVNSKVFVATLLNTLPSQPSYFNVFFTGKNTPVTGDKNISVTASETKNPEYKRDFTDMWGMYKSDYDPAITAYNLAKRVTDVSAAATDVWTLRQIENPTGAKIRITYESDEYKTPELYNGTYDMSISGMTIIDSDDISISFHNSPDLASAFDVGMTCDVLSCVQAYNYDGSDYSVKFLPVRKECVVSQVNTNSIVVTNSTLVSWLNSPHCFDNAITPRNFRLGCFPTTYTNTVIGGNIRGKKAINIKGGGLRVKSLKVSGSGLSAEMEFSYSEAPGLTSGVTPYEPVFTDPYTLSFPSSLSGINSAALLNAKIKGRESYRNIMTSLLSNVLVNARELPGPGVMYKLVTVKRKSNSVYAPEYVRYQFEVFDPSMIKNVVTSNTSGTSNFGTGDTYNTANRMMKIKNYASRIGALKAVCTFDYNNRMLTKISNQYLHDGKTDSQFETDLVNTFAGQGMIQQSFNEYRVAYKTDHMVVTSTREEYPLVNVATHFYDYTKGERSSTQTTAYDFYSGAVTKTLAKDSYGNYLLTETVPAYSKYPELGLKVNTYANRHIISPSTAIYTYKSDASGASVAPLSASVTTWNKVWNYRTYSSGDYSSTAITNNSGTVQDEQIWRPYRTYVWNSPMLNADGTLQDFVDFSWTSEASSTPQNKFWIRSSEITLYDAYSNPLEIKDVNGNYAATRMGDKDGQVMANATNSRYTEFTHFGAEDIPSYNVVSNHFSGEIASTTALASSTVSHTGKYSLSIPSTTTGFTYKIKHVAAGAKDFDLNKNYRASVWVYKDFISQGQLSYTIIDHLNGGTLVASGSVSGSTSLPMAGNWYLLSLDIPVPTSSAAALTLEVKGKNTGSSNTIYMDDFRFQPVESSMSSYVYDQKTGWLTHVINNKNLYTRFEYDPMGRLIATYKETLSGEKKMKDYYYNMARKP